MNLPLYYPLVDICRSGCIDNRFYALMYLADKNGEIIKFKGDDNNSKFFLRSLFKPIQSSILAEDKIYNRFKFTDAELAIMQGSHSGEPLHIELIHSILNKTGLNENCLLCPPIKPLNTAIYISVNLRTIPLIPVEVVESLISTRLLLSRVITA